MFHALETAGRRFRYFSHIRIDWYMVAAVLTALPLIAPFLQPGVPNVADAENHLYRIPSVLTSLLNGYGWPRWTPYLHGGYGYPLHNFHPPGVYIIEALTYIVTHADMIAISKVFPIATALLYPLGAYLFARTFANRPGALVAAAAYLYAPLRFRELWTQGDVPQFAAMALLPWLLWAIARTAERRTRLWVVLTGMLLCGLILFHHATTFLAVPMIGGYALLMIIDRYRARGRGEALKALGAVSIGGILGLALAAVFWIPALFELRNIQIGTVQDVTFTVPYNFVSLSTLLQGQPPIDRSLLNWAVPYGPNGVSVGLPQVGGLVLGLLVLLPIFRFRCSFRVKWHAVGAAGLAVVYLFLITPPSAGIWAIAPFATLVQFPWRLLGEVSVLVLPGAAILPELLPRRWQTWAAGALILVFFGSALPLLYAPLTFSALAPPTPAATITHENTTGDLGLTSTDEYLPHWVSVRPMAGFQTPALQSQAAAALQTLQWRVWIDDGNLPSGAAVSTEADPSPGTNRYQVQTPTAFLLTFHQMYYPGWQVKIDGQDVPVTPSTPNGLITTPIAAGTYEVTIAYAGTMLQHLADVLSGGALMVCAGLILADLIWRRSIWLRYGYSDGYIFSPRIPQINVRLSLTGLPLAQIVSIGSLLFVVINQAWIMPSTDFLRPQSDPIHPPASHALQITFGGVLQLLGYDLDSTLAAPGQSIHVRLYWRVTQPTNQELRASLTLSDPGGKQAWGQIDSFNLGRSSTASWSPNSYVIDDYDLPVAANAPPFAARLRLSVFPQDGPLHYLPTDQSATDAVIATIHISGDLKTVTESQLQLLDGDFADFATLIGYRYQVATAGQSCLLLRWQVHQPKANIQVMIHFIDSGGSVVGVADSPPLGGEYPTGQWQPGQILDDNHCFILPSSAKVIGIALYTLPSVQRLSLNDLSGKRLADDTFMLSIPDAAANLPN